MTMQEALQNYYENYDEDGRLRSKNGMVEYLTTMRYVEKYLKSGMRVLEIGAGTGRYSHTLARMGYQVDAVELLQHNIDIFRQNTQEGEVVTITQGNAMDLSAFDDNTYDITLLLGPMYHLLEEEEQLRALSEAIRVTKKGGKIFAAYCNNDATMVQYCFAKGMILEEPYRSLIDMTTFKARSTPAELFQLYRKEDVDALMSRFSVTRLHYLGTDMATKYIQDEVDAMSDELFNLYLQYHFTICERSDMTGTSHHVLDIFEKN